MKKVVIGIILVVIVLAVFVLLNSEKETPLLEVGGGLEAYTPDITANTELDIPDANPAKDTNPFKGRNPFE